jgi:hypothetical protein
MKYVRDGRVVWPYCESCSRRLEYTVFKNWLGFTHYYHVPENACLNRFETWWLEKKPEIARILGLE